MSGKMCFFVEAHIEILCRKGFFAGVFKKHDRSF